MKTGNNLAKKYLSENIQSDSMKELDKYFSEEIIIALCGQLGTNLKLVSNKLEHIMKTSYGYSCEIITMSDFIFEFSEKAIPRSDYERILSGMNGGDELRKKYSNHILADLAISKIGEDRFTVTPEQKIVKRDFESRRKCYIINSIKHPEEYSLFEKVYANSFYTLGVFSTYDERVQNLKRQFKDEEYPYIDGLIDRDTGADIQNGKNGQHVEDVFVKSDYFIRTSNDDHELKDKLHYFIDLIFDFSVNTPTKSETAMHHATASSVNSACLSRQVGACITDKDMNILSVGWNDVPSFGGGVYQNGTEPDERCYKKGVCTNSKKKKSMIENMLNDLVNSSIIKNTDKDDVEKILNNNGIKSLIEFAKSIHAEMHAIIIGSQRTGDKMIGGKLFCTTYPCHNCARHIILSGIKDVYFIEPYRKSLCTELHDDAITENEKDTDKVRILMYEGVAPKSFMKFYQIINDDRKSKVIGQDRKVLKPKHMIQLEALFERELHSTEFLNDHSLLPETKD